MASLKEYVLKSLLLWSSLAVTSDCGVDLDYDPNDDVTTGPAARQRIDEALPESATDFYVFDGGSFNGSIDYVSFTCATIDDCWTAVAALGGPDRDKFHPDIRSDYAVNIHGPSFYWRQMETEHWQISTEANGVSFETALDDRWMDFWAIDFDTKRVFFHHESGGFPTDPPSVRYRWAEK